MEPSYLMETDIGLIRNVPASKMEAFLAAQSKDPEEIQRKKVALEAKIEKLAMKYRNSAQMKSK